MTFPGIAITTRNTCYHIAILAVYPEIGNIAEDMFSGVGKKVMPLKINEKSGESLWPVFLLRSLITELKS